jgi:hypothetical protein
MLQEVPNAKRTRSFLNESEDTVFHIIETGFALEQRKYLVVQENAYQDRDFGKTEFMTDREIFYKYNIKL